MKYALSANGLVIDVLRVDPITVRLPEMAAQYREAPENVELGWLDSGKDYSQPLSKPIAIPETVEAWQAKRALVDSGHYARVEGAIAALEDDPESLAIKVDWASAKTFRRDWPALVALAAQLDLDADDLDALFVHAATL